MKIQHILYALEIARAGSISKAANSLLLSQPNISSAIKTLEDELGFAIFSRTNKGILVTPKGKDFLISAQTMADEYKRMMAIKNEKILLRFHLSAGYHSSIEDAFTNLCIEQPTTESIDFIIQNTSLEEIIDHVYLGKSNLGVLFIPDDAVKQYRSHFQKKGIEMEIIKPLQFRVYLNSNHPLLQEETFDFEKLKDYPFVDYKPKVLTTGTNSSLLSIVDPDKYILVDDRDTRCQIVSMSNAISVGYGISKRIMQRYNWVSIPFDGVVSNMTAIWRKNVPLSKEGKRYLQLLREETQFLE